MEPGKELDAKVATHVMDRHPFRGAGITENRDGTVAEFCQDCGKPKGYHITPPYSTDIAAAWTVNKPGWFWRFQESRRGLAVTLYTSFGMMQKAIRDHPRLPEESILIGRAWLDDKAATYAWLRCLAALEAAGVICVPEGESITLGDRAVLENVTIMGVGDG